MNGVCFGNILYYIVLFFFWFLKVCVFRLRGFGLAGPVAIGSQSHLRRDEERRRRVYGCGCGYGYVYGTTATALRLRLRLICRTDGSPKNGAGEPRYVYVGMQARDWLGATVARCFYKQRHRENAGKGLATLGMQFSALSLTLSQAFPSLLRQQLIHLEALRLRLQSKGCWFLPKKQHTNIVFDTKKQSKSHSTRRILLIRQPRLNLGKHAAGKCRKNQAILPHWPRTS